MYHIPSDKRAQRSAEALCVGLLDCLEHKSYTDVTVQDLRMASGVSRATFYRLFDNISDIFLNRVYRGGLKTTPIQKKYQDYKKKKS